MHAMATRETMMLVEALEELRAVGADAKVWAPYAGARKTLYVNAGPRWDGFQSGVAKRPPAIATLWASAGDNVDAGQVWRAVYLVVSAGAA